MNKLLFAFVVIVAFVLRFYQLGNNPPSLDWDEASLGHNAYSILKTGADEYGNKWPIAFRSFDDFKPPAYVYLAVPSVALFGLTEFAVRSPSALFGVLTVLVTYFLVKELFKKNSHFNNPASHVALLSSFLLAISPWHLQFSRAAFESNIGLFFFVLGTYFIVRGVRDGRFQIASFATFALSLYAYHSLRLVAPLFLFGLFVYWRRELWQNRKYVVIASVIAGGMLLPLIGSFLVKGGGASRFSSVTILKPEGTLDYSIKQLQFDKERGDSVGALLHNRRIVYVLTALKGYLDHWNFEFLFLRGDGIGRHHATAMGMLYLIEMPFVLAGIYFLFHKKIPNAPVLFWWFLVAPSASAITTGTPHPVRALVLLPTLQVFAATGIVFAFEYMRQKHARLFIPFVTGFILLFLGNVVYYLHQYYVHTPVETSANWQYGYKQVFEEIRKVEAQYDKIIVTYRYDQPYIYYLFYGRVDPSWYQKNWDYLGNGKIERDRRIIGKYEFRNIDWENDKILENALLVGTPDEIPFVPKMIKEVRFLDGTVAFRIAGT